MKAFSIAVVLLGLSQAGFAGIYELKFDRVTGSKETSRCKAFSDEAAKEFSRQSGARIIESGCRKDDFSNPGLSAIITYEATARFETTSSHHTSVYGAAFYARLKDCEQHLEEQELRFVKETGLKVLVSYCMRDLGISHSRWETRVDGLGTSNQKPNVAAITLWGTVADVNLIIENYKVAASDYGIAIFEGGIDVGGVGRHLVLRYYAPAPYNLQDYSEVSFEGSADCESAAETAKHFLEGTAKPVVLFCEKSNARRGFKLHVTHFSNILQPERLFKVNRLTTQYATLSACQHEASKLPTSSDIFGAVCGGAGNDFHIHLFSKW